MSLSFILLGTVALLAASPISIACRSFRFRSAALYLVTLALCSGLLAAALTELASDPAGGDPPVLVLPLGIPWIGAHFRLDSLTAFFLAVINLGGAAASLYAVGYGRHEQAPGRILPFFPLFLAGMNLVVVADDAFTFLVAWEFMSLASWAMVMAHHHERRNTEAGYLYLIMASFGTLSLILAFGVLAGVEGGYAFAEMRTNRLSPERTAIVLALLMLGAGSKAGLFPLHVWLPLAHPAAPSHVSALMSGVMTKVAVYSVIRILFDLLGTPAWWWGAVILTVGGITAVIGVLYALMQHDLKRLLAYHTVENIGIIFVGLGLALAFRANGMAAAAALALVAALFHVFNHAVFKSLLFFGSGAVLAATGQRDMEHLGGLIHRMPVTAATFLIGAAAISALPPLNGFVSEWLIFQAILVSPELPQWTLKFLVPAVGAGLALAAALAATCFVKAFGITFLGRPRRAAAAAAREVDRWSLAAMAGLAFLCVFAGIVPGLIVDALATVGALLAGNRLPDQATLPWLTLVPIAEERSSYNGLLVFAFITVSAVLAVALVRLVAAHGTRRAAAWDCGFPEASPETQYTAGSFAQPIRRVFGSVVFGAREAVRMPPPGALRPAVLRVRLRDFAWLWLYLPVAAAIDTVSGRMNGLQFLTIRRYLGLVFGVMVLLLVVLAVGQ
jgi:formate hydrogenlyase subunit 3/multisubunit Na+/H+ antiporter MnhD subunit